MMRANKLTLAAAIRILGLLACIIPPALAVLAYFPLWREAGAEKVISGGAILLLTLAHAPLFRWLKRQFASPAGYTVWFLIFIAFLLVSAIADEMKVISFVGFISNLSGAVLFRISERIGDVKNEREE